MENLFKELSILGIILTTLFTSFGYFYKTYLDRKKTIKQVLFYYLELIDILEKRYVSVDSITNKYCELLHEKGCLVTDKIKFELNNSIKDLFKNIDINIDKEFIVKLRSSVSELSKIDPVFAYELNNKEIIFKTIDSLIENNMLLDDKVLQFILNDLNEQTLEIAKKVNFLTFLNVKRIIRFNRVEKTIEIIDEMYGDLLNKIAK